MKDRELLGEVAYNVAAKGLPKAYQAELQIILVTGTVELCLELMTDPGTG